jgi:hypothetical protein
MHRVVGEKSLVTVRHQPLFNGVAEHLFADAKRAKNLAQYIVT